MIETLTKMLKDYFRLSGIFLEVNHNREKSERQNGMYYTITNQDEYVADFNLIEMTDDYRASTISYDQMCAEVLEALIDTVEERLELV
jgi:hypothetical protein